MWTADGGARHPGPRRLRSQRGFTVLETTIYLALLSVLGLVVERTLTTVRDATGTLQALQETQRRAEQLVYRLRQEVASSRKLFYRGTVGNGYLAALDVGRGAPAPGTRLPLPDETSELGPDLPGAPRTANVLLFARAADPYACPADPVQRKIRHIDVSRFVCVYPHEVSPEGVSTGGGPGARDLVVWCSTAYTHYQQLLSAASGTERSQIVQSLYSTYGVRYAWNVEAPVEQAFYALDYLGNISDTPDPAVVIEEDLRASGGGQLVYANCQLARTDPASVARRALLTVDDWVPDGFEVKVVGPSGAREVWMRLVVEAQSPRARDVVYPITFLVTTRDL